MCCQVERHMYTLKLRTLNKPEYYLQLNITMNTSDSVTSIFCTVCEQTGKHWFKCYSIPKYLFGLSFTPITESTITLFRIESVEVMFACCPEATIITTYFPLRNTAKHIHCRFSLFFFFNETSAIV